MQQRRRCKNFLALLFIWLTAYAAITLLYYVYRRTAQSLPTPQRFHSFNLISDYKCGCAREEDGQHANGEMGEESVPEMVLPTTTTAARRILLLTDHKSANHQILDFFNFFKVPIRVEEHSPAGHLLLELPDGSARFSLIIFEDYRIFHLLYTSQKQALSSYCTKHSIGIISFLVLLEDNNDQQQLVFTNFIAHGKRTIIQDISFVNDSSTLRIGRANCPYKLDKTEQQLNWTLFTPSSQESKPLLSATISNGSIGHPALQIGQKHIVFGARPEHFLIKIALMDAVNYLAPNIRQEDLIRNVQIDIDDVFVGSSGARFISDDVRALVKTQNHLRGGINNFSFTLGFSGYYFRHGTDLEIQGDELLTANAREFHWFPHMWRHNHAHEHSAEYLVALMAQNRIFAHNSGLPTNLHYAISPQHSGVYPVYQSLYDGWKQIWDVQVTSTEEYPHLRPASKRRGFIHSNIRVLPRQTCGLFTHTQFFHAYPDGIGHFLANIYGGDLFTTILMNKFSIFMTHQQNYANDRLGTFTFRNLVNFLRCWTNLRLHWVEPKEMAERYFQQFPTERKLLYTNICSDKRHRRMLPANYSCDTLTLPNLVILGPQKTGTSALAMFLQLHPNISTNQPVAGSFEELQFFAGPNYAKGLDWYADKFAHVSPPNGSSVVFEKTANYFDNPAAPEALNALLPSAKLLVILIDPVLRAYSWYQHMRAHNDSMALKYTAEEIFVGNGSGAEKLKNRSLWPGLYAQHLDRWLDTFPASQLILVDGDQLQNEPHFVLRELFSGLGLPPLNGLAHRLKYSPEKGFYCVVHQLENRNGTIQKEKDSNVKIAPVLSPPLRCLGSSKGRHYQPMSHRLRQHLEAHFRGPNLALKQLLRKYKFPVPKFLLSVS